jgi:hypothetical protein
VTGKEAVMYNRNPQDVAHERTDVPETYDENRERLAASEAEVRGSTDLVSGTPPATEPVAQTVDEDEPSPRRAR